MPPVGVYIVAGCGADLLINICLTLLGYVLPYIVECEPFDCVLTLKSIDTFPVTSTLSTSNMYTMSEENLPERVDSRLREPPVSIASAYKVADKDMELSFNL